MFNCSAYIGAHLPPKLQFILIAMRNPQLGILEMDIYMCGNTLFMIVETPLDFNWDAAFNKLATLPRQKEWEEYMSVFQDVKPGLTSDEKWKPLKRIFHLYE